MFLEKQKARAKEVLTSHIRGTANTTSSKGEVDILHFGTQLGNYSKRCFTIIRTVSEWLLYLFLSST